MAQLSKAAIIGGGIIGGGWAARFIENGVDVAIYDPAPDVKNKLDAILVNAEHAYAKLTMASRLHKGTITWCKSAPEAARDAQLIVEAVPERPDIKRSVYAQIETTAAKDAIIASSTSGIMPSELQKEMQHPERLIVGHPFNPVYLLPLVELVAGEKTDPKYIKQAKQIYSGLGMHPLHCRVEIEGFISDRLQEALWREALWLLHDKVASAEELDTAIAYGPGLRWAQMGTMQTFHLAGGEGGMRAMLAMFGPCLKWPWTKLMDVPELSEEFINDVGDQCEAQAAGLGPRELERIRDDNLIAIMQALKANDWGAGKTLAAYEKKLFDQGAPDTSDQDYSKPIRTMQRQVPPDWTDYNCHMNEARYLQCFGDSSDCFLRMIGVDAAYVESGKSYFTVETHIRHIDEVQALEPIYTLTQVLEVSGKKLRLFHHLYHENGRLLATGEHMFIHVDLASRSASEPDGQVLAKAQEFAKLHESLPNPDGMGRAVGQSR